MTKSDPHGVPATDTAPTASLGCTHSQGFQGIDRMTLGVHQLDFWTRIAGNCGGAGCRRTHCSDLVPELAGGQAKCQTHPERYAPVDSDSRLRDE